MIKYKKIKDEYLISSVGKVYSLKRKKMLKQFKDNNGYLEVCLSKNGKKKNYLVHRLVAEAFIQNPLNYTIVDHIIPISQGGTNEVWNLRWCKDQMDNLSNENSIKNRIGCRTNRQDQSKPVLQFTLDGEFIARYPSAQEVERQLGFNPASISKCCRGKYKTAYNYKWSYE